jgi:hypothetical protein
MRPQPPPPPSPAVGWIQFGLGVRLEGRSSITVAQRSCSADVFHRPHRSAPATRRSPSVQPLRSSAPADFGAYSTETKPAPRPVSSKAVRAFRAQFAERTASPPVSVWRRRRGNRSNRRRGAVAATRKSPPHPSARAAVSARLTERLRALLGVGAFGSSAASRRLSCRTAAAGAFDLPFGGGAEVLLLCACPARYRLDQPGPPGCAMRGRAGAGG